MMPLILKRWFRFLSVGLRRSRRYLRVGFGAMAWPQKISCR